MNLRDWILQEVKKGAFPSPHRAILWLAHRTLLAGEGVSVVTISKAWRGERLERASKAGAISRATSGEVQIERILR